MKRRKEREEGQDENEDGTSRAADEKVRTLPLSFGALRSGDASKSHADNIFPTLPSSSTVSKNHRSDLNVFVQRRLFPPVSFDFLPDAFSAFPSHSRENDALLNDGSSGRVRVAGMTPEAVEPSAQRRPVTESASAWPHH
jgi:hypothetical protein